MNDLIELSDKNINSIRKAYDGVPRVDISIDCALEGSFGKIYTENINTHKSYLIKIGPFNYFAGEPNSDLIKLFYPYDLLMPSEIKWIEYAHQVFPSLQEFPRYSFDNTLLDIKSLQNIIEKSKYKDSCFKAHIKDIDEILSDKEEYLDITVFGNIDNFLSKSICYTIKIQEKIAGIAYSSLISSDGVETSIYIKEKYRQRGLGKLLAANFIIECLNQGKKPNWDAANTESVKLANSLGFKFKSLYKSYYYT
jgi:hypothetical protein